MAALALCLNHAWPAHKLCACRPGAANARATRRPIVVTGHSLGAGIATFVGMHLRRVFADVKVWCYSPPGWLMTPQLAEGTKHFVTSVVVNKDLVPRLTLRSLERLRDELVAAGVRCRHSKARVVTGTVCGGGLCCQRRRKKWQALEAMFLPPDRAATAASRGFLDRCVTSAPGSVVLCAGRFCL